MKLFTVTLSAKAVALTLASAAVAETVVQDVTIVALIEADCTVTGDVLDFGTYDPRAGKSLIATAQIGLSCPEGTEAKIQLDGGNNLDGDERRMAGGRGGLLRYNLYSDQPNGQVWGDGVTIGQPLVTTFQSLNPTRPVFGVLPAGQ